MPPRGARDLIEAKILVLRGQKVILDSELAKLYEVKVKQLNQAVKRNADRFPDDFAFQITKPELDSLRSQNVTLGTGEGRGRFTKYLPSAVLGSSQASSLVALG
jgi:hypothetical protein